MNLGNGKSGDWDVLAKNINMVIGDADQDYGWDLTLFYGTFGEPIVVEAVGKRRKRIVQYRRLVAEVLSLEWALGIHEEMKFELEIPLGILLTDSSFVLEHVLGIPRVQEINAEIPLSVLRYNLNDLEISMPLIVSRSSSMDVEISLGKTLEQSRKKLKKLREALERISTVD